MDSDKKIYFIKASDYQKTFGLTFLDILPNNIGLEFISISEVTHDDLIYSFRIIDKSLFFLAKIKYGI